MHISRKRLLLSAGGITAVGAAATLALGATFGLFTATTASQSNSFQAGTVTLSQSVTHSCTVSNLVPGDASTGYSPTPAPTPSDVEGTTCAFTVTYGGNAPAFLGVDVSVAGIGGTTQTPYASPAASAAPTAAAGLYDGTATGLQLLVTSAGHTSVTYNAGDSWSETTLNSTPANASANDVLVDPAAAGTYTFSIDWFLPYGSTNAYQNAKTTITMTVHAVQSGNNGSASSCTNGHICAGITSWS